SDVASPRVRDTLRELVRLARFFDAAHAGQLDTALQRAAELNWLPMDTEAGTSVNAYVQHAHRLPETLQHCVGPLASAVASILARKFDDVRASLRSMRAGDTGRVQLLRLLRQRVQALGEFVGMLPRNAVPPSVNDEILRIYHHMA
ncbi:MAG: hypothetical protein MHM6MM_007393, partial [Cercozoa sp. M6MM]